MWTLRDLRTIYDSKPTVARYTDKGPNDMFYTYSCTVVRVSRGLVQGECSSGVSLPTRHDKEKGRVMNRHRCHIPDITVTRPEFTVGGLGKMCVVEGGKWKGFENGTGKFKLPN